MKNMNEQIGWNVNLIFYRMDDEGDMFQEEYEEEAFIEGVGNSIKIFGLPQIGYKFISSKYDFIVEGVVFIVDEMSIDISLVYEE